MQYLKLKNQICRRGLLFCFFERSHRGYTSDILTSRTCFHCIGGSYYSSSYPKNEKKQNQKGAVQDSLSSVPPSSQQAMNQIQPLQLGFKTFLSLTRFYILICFFRLCFTYFLRFNFIVISATVEMTDQHRQLCSSSKEFDNWSIGFSYQITSNSRSAQKTRFR